MFYYKFKGSRNAFCAHLRIARRIETELWFYVPLDTKQVISETFPQVNLLAWYGKKLNLTQQKRAFTNQKKCITTQNKHQKNKARFSRLLRHAAWKRSGSILKGKEK